MYNGILIINGILISIFYGDVSIVFNKRTLLAVLIFVFFISIVAVSASDVNELDVEIDNGNDACLAIDSDCSSSLEYSSTLGDSSGLDDSSTLGDSSSLNDLYASVDTDLDVSSDFDDSSLDEVSNSVGSGSVGSSLDESSGSVGSSLDADSDYDDLVGLDEVSSSSNLGSSVSDSDNPTLGSSKEVQTKKKVSNSKTDVYRYSFVSRNVKYRPKKCGYVYGNTSYNVKAYDIVKYNGKKYISPLYNASVKLKVFTGRNYRTYTARIGEDGIASIKIPGLSVGVHKVEIYLGNQRKGVSRITVIKSRAKVYSPISRVKYKSNSAFYIKVSDNSNTPVRNLRLNVKVFSGREYKNYNLRTNSKGLVCLNTKGLGLGNHKVIIRSSNKNLNVFKVSRIIVPKSLGRSVLKLNAYAPPKVVKTKRGTYFNILVSDSFGIPKKGINLKVKVFTNGKYRIYNLRTNSRGIARINTHRLSLGTHRVTIESGNRYYKIRRSSKIIVKNSLETQHSPAPCLKSLLYTQKNEDYYAILQWKAKRNSYYQVLRKSNGRFDVVAIVKANSTIMSYSNKVSKGKLYTYSVREVLKNGGNNVLGVYDAEGLRLIDSPRVSVDFQNLKAVIKWKRMSNVTKYAIYRKIGRNGKYKCIANVDGKSSNYTDNYYRSKDDLSKLIRGRVFISASDNNLFYTVRAYEVRKANAVTKTSCGLYSPDGDFNLESPNIVSLENNVLVWGTVPNAEGYLILKKVNQKGVWQKIADVNAKQTTLQSLNVGEVDKNSYYAVQAYAKRNGEVMYSGYDTGFSLKDFSLENVKERILFIGDSISYGAPYSLDVKQVFSIPYRVAQLLGCVYYNPSIPGASYHDLGQHDDANIYASNNRSRITTDVIDRLANGKPPAKWKRLEIGNNSLNETNTRIEDYNIVVLCAGTNDYRDNAVLGSLDSNDTYTFNGALNYIIGKIEDASKKRVENGEEPIKVVFVDLYYSDLMGSFIELNNRDTTPNKIGLTLTDYQKALSNQLKRWKTQTTYLEFYNFKTRDYNIVNRSNCPYTTADNLHFTKFTYSQYGNAFAQFLVDNVF